MDLSTFPPIAVVLGGLQSLVTTLGVLVEPVVGASAAAVGIVLLTLLVRLVLVPVGVSQVRAEIARRRLAPAIADLTRRIADPEARSKALMALYATEKVSPLAGCLPTLAQAPVLTAVYSLFAHSEIAGHANTLLTHTLGGAALGANLFVTLGTGLAAVWPYLVLLVLLAIVVELSRRATVRFTGSAAGPTAGQGQEALPGMAGVLRWLPFVSVLFAAFAPLAAALYLVTSAAWTLGERAVLRRVLAR
jgi:YidC/Oxa1 family membrane protein insertase